MAIKSLVCPRCGGGIPNDTTPGAYPGALSRWDNHTEICSDCGRAEALIQWAEGLAGRDRQRAVHPTWGHHLWFAAPEEVKQ